jgi:glycosyltransferase involved in cell wall biosynthesis
VAVTPDNLDMGLAGRSILVVAADWPWPANYSARIDVLDHIETLGDLGVDVDLLVTAGPHDFSASAASVASKVRNMIAVRRNNGLLDYFGFAAPGQVYSRRGLRHVKLPREYDFVLVEGAYVSEILKNEKVVAKHWILRINNDESKYFFQLAKANLGVASFYYLAEAIRFFFYERELLRLIPNWLVSSYKEYSILLNKESCHEDIEAAFLPPKVNLKSKSASLKYIHPKLLLIPGYQLTIAGHAGAKSQRITIQNKYGNYDGVDLVLSPPTTEELYASAAVFINPMRFGAGIKLKTVHAIAAGIPVVSTAVGAEGTQMFHEEHLMITDDPVDFCDHVSEILLHPSASIERSRRAISQLNALYDQTATMRKFLTRILKNNSTSS